MVKFHGLIKLHITHSVIAFFGAMTCAPASGSLKAYGDTRLPPDVLLEEAYKKLRRIAIPVITLQAISATAFLIIICTDMYRRRALPAILELLNGCICFALQLASVLIIWNAKAKALFTYWEESLAIGLFPGASNGFPGDVGQYDFADGSATIIVMWQFASIFSTISLIFLGLHILWHLLVTARHVRTRPHVFLEAVSGDFAWHLKPDPNAHKKLPTVKQDLLPLEPLGASYLKK